MQTAKLVLNDLLNNLEEEDYRTVIDFIEYLSAKRQKERIAKNNAILSELQFCFADDKGWQSEEAMLADMAAFRKGRLGI